MLRVDEGGRLHYRILDTGEVLDACYDRRQHIRVYDTEEEVLENSDPPGFGDDSGNSAVMRPEVISEAKAFAETVHAGQTRKYGHANVPYINHPRRVASIVATNPNMTMEMVVAAWLHDTVEDGDDPGRILEDIRAKFGNGVAEMVSWLTNPIRDIEAPRWKQKKMDREHLAKAPYGAKLVKLADRLDNLREMVEDSEVPGDFRRMYADETELLLDEALKRTDVALENELRGLIERLR